MQLSIAALSVPPAEMPFPFASSCGMDAIMERVSTQPAPMTQSGKLVPLLGAIASGDRAALSELYRHTSAKLFGISVRVLESEAEAEEVLQEVYVTVWNKAAQFDAEKASPITWLGVITRNKAIDRLRSRRFGTERIEAAAGVADDSPSAFDVIERSEEHARLAGCLDQLEDRQQAMIRAAFFGEATYPELAERESVPLGTMKSWIRRSLLRLRGCLEQ